MQNRIRILATTDIHGHIYPYRYHDGLSAYHGLARLKTAIDQFRDENTILVDNGDVLQGSSLQFYHYTVHQDDLSPVTRCMNLLQYDYVSIGNHDFDYGEPALLAHLSGLRAPCITNNVIYRGEPLCPTYVIHEAAGKKIALFGIVTHYVKNWEKKQNVKHFSFKDAYLSAVKTVDLIRTLEKPDYIIALYHGGFERDVNTGLPIDDELTDENQAYKMIRQIPGLDVLIMGHTHSTRCGTAFGTAYVQAGKYGESLACIDIYTDTGVIEPRVFKVDTEPDEAVMDLVKEEEDACQTWLDTPLGTCGIDLSITDQTEARLHKSQVATFINRIMLEATGADLASTPLFNRTTGFRRDITMRDLVSTYRYENSLVVKKLTGRELRAYLERTAKFWSVDGGQIVINPRYLTPKLKLYYYDMIDGIDYTINVSNDPGQRITELTYQGQEVRDDMEFTICVSSFRASGGGHYLMIKNAPTVKELRTGIVDLIALWIMNHQVIEFEPVNNIHIVR